LFVSRKAVETEVLRDRDAGREERCDESCGTTISTRENEERDRLKAGEIVSLKEVVAI
jgi:hypothetical protein